MKKSVFLVCCLLSLCSTCFAVTFTSESTLNLSDGYEEIQKTYFNQFNYSFLDKYNFSISGTNNVQSYSSSWTIESLIEGYNLLAINNFSVSLFNTLNPNKEIFQDTSTGPQDNIIEYAGTLASGSYYFLVSGVTSGLSGGAYSLEVKAVPIPAVSILLGAGLLGIVGIRRRQTI
mgnify:CR=1 FL=1